jgi:hypothetical protein
MVIFPGRARSWRAALALFCALAAVPTLRAQDSPFPRVLALVAGPAEYDLAGNGWSWTAAVRLGIPLTSALVLEPGLGFFTYSSQFGGDRVSFFLPEVTLQLQYPGQRVQPYLGVGAGAALMIEGYDQSLGSLGPIWGELDLSAEPRIEPSAHASVGLRAEVVQNWGVLGEARVRNISFFKANNAIMEVVLGFTRRF